MQCAWDALSACPGGYRDIGLRPAILPKCLVALMIAVTLLEEAVISCLSGLTAAEPKAMAQIFISYRREDSAYVAGMLSEKLQDRFGKGPVYLDIDNIPFGVDFREHINSAVGQCDMLLALIGDAWITTRTNDGRRRLDNPADFVRLEIESALARNIPVVPVLLSSTLVHILRLMQPERGHRAAGSGRAV